MENFSPIGQLAEMFWIAAKLAMPFLMTALLVGLVISIFQVATQIQDMSLTFVPKLIAVVVLAGVIGHWFFDVLSQYSIGVISSISSLRP